MIERQKERTNRMIYLIWPLHPLTPRLSHKSPIPRYPIPQTSANLWEILVFTADFTKSSWFVLFTTWKKANFVSICAIKSNRMSWYFCFLRWFATAKIELDLTWNLQSERWEIGYWTEINLIKFCEYFSLPFTFNLLHGTGEKSKSCCRGWLGKSLLTKCCWLGNVASVGWFQQKNVH